MKISVITPTIRGLKALRMAEKSLKKQSFKDFEWIIHVEEPTKPSLNRTYNKLIRAATGELIVFLQDYIEITKHGLLKFLEAYEQNPKAFFTAPVGMTTDFKNIKWDWRKDRSNDEPLNHLEWEINWAAAPRTALVEIGGFDEEMDDNGWGFDNVNIGLRAEIAGYKIINIRENPAIGYNHYEGIKHPFRHTRNEEFHNWRMQEIRMGKRIRYLD